MIKSRAILIILVIVFALISAKDVHATHLRAGEIVVERVNCQSLTFRITILVYADTESGVKFGEGVLRLGDGSDLDSDDKPGFVIPIVEYTLRPDLGENIATASYTWEHTYGAPGKYIISYFENNRNDGILNMNNSVQTPFYIEAEINIDPFLGCNNSPVLLIPPIDVACPGVAFFHNPGAFDPDGDSLSFELVVPKMDVGTTVDNYRYPNQQEFFNELPFTTEEGDAPPVFSIDPITGEVRWDAPGDVGNPMGREYNLAFRVNEWRKIGDEWFNLGYVVRDMQIIVIDCENERPGLIVPEDICVEAGTLIDEQIFGIDPDFDQVKIEAFSQIFDMNGMPADYNPKNVFQSTLPPNDTANVRFTWQTDCAHVRDQAYQVVFKITDRPDNGPKLVEFATWNITIVAPEPTWVDAQIDFPQRGVDLEWDSYTCQNAQELQVWRRVDSFNYIPDFCETGVPDFLGYELIADLDPSQTTYFDDNGGLGLNFGASYCYRLVAIFRQPSGGESTMSLEICVPPLKADAPVVTNVTVDETDRLNGEVTIRWTPPFEIDETQFGTDYTYEIERSEGLVGTSFEKIGKKMADTTFTDVGLNTQEKPYTYRIILYSNDAVLVGPDIPIIGSAEASTVYLQPRPLFEQIELFWIAEVPWSNHSQDYPWHYIYRKLEEETNDQFVLIDSVNVNSFGFTYTDTGKFNDEPLVENQVYCYYITTQGTYGNPAIDEPLINDSQIVCAQPSDDVAPCVPVVTVESQTCEDFLNSAACEFNQFENVLRWSTQGSECQDDIARYDIFYSESAGGEYGFLASTIDTVFIDDNLISFARCYKIRAVDLSGNISEFTKEICFDNCPYYELPNVFTPGNNDGCNDLFSAYSNRTEGGQSCGIQDVDPSKCARFVKSVHFKVLNRWGKLVYEYQSGGERTIYIDWNGKDLNGNDLAAGTYYYLAEVTFDVVNTDERVQNIKGWVQILR